MEVDIKRLAAIRTSFKNLNNFEKRAKLVEFRQQGRQRIREATKELDAVVASLHGIISEKLIAKIVALGKSGTLPQKSLWLLQKLHREVTLTRIEEADKRLQDQMLSRGGFHDGAKVPGSNLRKVDRARRN
jgi:hypothetical protein